jgi:cell pole-organizing protein PopZ
MEEILASIRRIIADDDAGKPPKPPEQTVAKPTAAPPPPAPEPAPPPAGHSQDEVDAMLADLEPPKAAAPQPEPPKAEPAPPADVFDLTEAMAAPAPQPDSTFRTIEGASDVVFTDPSPLAAEHADEASPAPDRTLLSSATAAAVDHAFNSLAHTVLGQNARTLEDLVKEMLRPMLKSWLDDNLPSLVERIVRAEIERVSRGRG